MKQIPVQQDGVTELPAADFNQIPQEEQNAIQSTGQTLSTSDLYQLAKAMQIYGSRGDFYSDTGVADQYILLPQGSMQAPDTYTHGLRARFIASNTNTGASDLKIGTLAYTPIKYEDAITGNILDVAAGDIVFGVQVEVVYDSVFDTSPFWRLVSVIDDNRVRGISFDKLIGSAFSLTDSTKTATLQANSVNILNTAFSGQYVELQNSGSIGPNILFVDGTNKTRLMTGVKFEGGPGESAFDVIQYRKAVFLYSPGSWSYDSNFIYNCTTNLTTDIPSTCKILRTSVYWSDGGNDFTSPAYVRLVADAGVWKITDVIVWSLGTEAPPTGAGAVNILVEYDSRTL